MSIIKIKKNNNSYTLVPNIFIDNFLANSNGEFIKVYLLLLKNANNNSFSTSDFADALHMTEADINRAIKYWENNGILELIKNNNQEITSIAFIDLFNNNSSNSSNKFDNNLISKLKLSSKPQYEVTEVSSFLEKQEYEQLIYITQKFLGKMLTQQDINTLISFNDWLGLPFDVIELLIEYCVSNNHRNMKYIEQVAITWSDEGITTIAKAEHAINNFNKQYYKIMKSLGLSNLNPTPSQIKYMKKWIDIYNFSLEIIIEACNRTIQTINQPQFSYIDAILTKWFDSNIKTITDVNKNDETFKNNSKQKKKSNSDQPSKFVNYDQRTYDFDELEKKAMELLIEKNI